MATKQTQDLTPILTILLLFLFLNMIVTSNSAPLSSDATNLLKLKESFKNDSHILASWSPSMSPCFGEKNNWVGIICSQGGSIWGLRLENMGLSGSVNIDSLIKLPRLRSISFINNSFGGLMPEFRKLKPLQLLFLSNNNFEGSIDPNAFEGMRRLRKLHLAYNKFNGEIPKSLTMLPKLVELRLEGNQFHGVIPDITTSTLKSFNVSNNQLEGPIPASLAKFNSSAFAGNKELCGSPMSTTCSSPSNQNKSAPLVSDKPIPIIAIVAGVVVIMVLVVLIILIIFRNNNSDQNHKHGSSTQPPEMDMIKNIESANEGSHRSNANNGGRDNYHKTESGKLTFIREDREMFDLPDLLKAAAEMLGSGCFGSSYKATLNSGNIVVVKRFKQMNNVGREEFQEHMRRLGRLSHPNLLLIVAYYYRKEEKLFITDLFQKGSLANLLHGQEKGTPTLDWPTRLKVIKGVSRGLLELYKELPCLVAPHGHLKSSNILLNELYEPVLSDYGLIPLINQESAQKLMVAYKSPEYLNNGRITKKTDVWALGILIIETLTGKYPTCYLQQESEMNMQSWVESVVHVGFDKNMEQMRHSEREMQKLLEIGISCCEINVDKRLDIKEACERIEKVRERDNEEDFYSTYASTEADVRSPRETSDDFTVIIN